MKLLPLVTRAQGNDDNALIEIFKMFEPKIQKSLRVIKRHDMKEDYKQEVYLRIIKAVRKYDLENVPDFIQYITSKK
ncbi:helix-turn-helix domain-containing protein [Brevibacillus sp. BC25]|uniref:helix-turn-helix domain-containing protein n=1 Tax=Brevibacillus sp. BC25 TaxID=1144308 RepID=UPI000270F55D|nr:helix-turn-helix domain-containing protein [Brevibacillus sp. BC25]EJL21023.1 hypothetical protein PMI05_05635 [Brevibacillus sp. BC25]